MAVYKDKKIGTWYVSLYYTDWTGKQQRKHMAVKSLSDRKEDTSLFQGSGDAGYHTKRSDHMAERDA